MNKGLAADLPKALRRRRYPLAIDLTLIPYHGEPYLSPAEIYRGEPKSGTSHFHAYATAYVVRDGRRFTVAMTRVLYGEPIKEVVQRLLQQASRIGVKPRYLLLDRGFYNVEVVRYLQAARYPFLMPVARRGRKPRDPEKSQSVWRFFTWKRSGWSQHRWRDPDGRLATVGVCVVYGRFGRRGQRRRLRALVYAYWGFHPPSCDWVRETYRTRFAIETTYRQMNQARIRTCTRDPLLAAAVRGAGVDPAECVGVVAFDVSGGRPSRSRRTASGATTIPADVDLAATLRRKALRLSRFHRGGTSDAAVTCVIFPP